MPRAPISVGALLGILCLGTVACHSESQGVGGGTDGGGTFPVGDGAAPAMTDAPRPTTYPVAPVYGAPDAATFPDGRLPADAGPSTDGPAPDAAAPADSASAVGSIRLSPAVLDLQVGDTGTVSALVLGRDGQPTSAALTWLSTSAGVASVAEGQVHALAPGAAMIFATAGGVVSNMVAVRVRAAMPTGVVVRVSAASTGMPVAGATIVLTDTQQKEVGRALSDDGGGATITGLPPGILLIAVSAPGYRNYSGRVGVATGMLTQVTATLMEGGLRMTWTFTDGCADGQPIDLRLFDRANQTTWPPAGVPPWLIPSDGSLTMAIDCAPGATVCYGGRPRQGAGPLFWGVDLDGTQSCAGCCLPCQTAEVARNLVCDGRPPLP